MNRQTGRDIGETDHLRQSIGDILSTPLGSRVMRRDYGSQLAELIDQPFNAATRLRAYAAVAAALMRWEPRIRVNRIVLELQSSEGAVVLTLDGHLVDASAQLNIRVPLQFGAVS